MRVFATVKRRVVVMMIVFAILITSLVCLFSFYLMYQNQKKTTIQSSQFNLQLVANLVQQDFYNLTALGHWATNNKQVTDYLVRKEITQTEQLTIYQRISEEYKNNRGKKYIHRFIISTVDNSRFIQIGDYINNSRPVSTYTLEEMFRMAPSNDSQWETITQDTFYFANNPLVLPFTKEIYNTNGEAIGNVFLSVNTSIITDKLAGYKSSDEASLYVTLGERTYELTDKSFELMELSSFMNNNKYTIVSYPILDNIILTEVISSKQFMPEKGAWATLLIIICLMILILTLLAIFFLNKNISKPIANISKKIKEIGSGDFSHSSKIESNTELGEVGKGINQLSHEIVALMSRKIEDEKKRQELEYQMLQSQINPHFLYNTLNSIKWMASLQGATGIAEMTTSLSRLLKTISKDVRKLVPLSEELALLDDYFIIQKYRYGGTITLNKEIVSPEALSTNIPRFSLQPLVENAIFHGIEPKGHGTITVKVELLGNRVFCSIIDNGVGMNKKDIVSLFDDTSESSGMLKQLGFRNVNARLMQAFGDEHGLSVQSELNQSTQIIICLPFDKRRNYYD